MRGNDICMETQEYFPAGGPVGGSVGCDRNGGHRLFPDGVRKLELSWTARTGDHAGSADYAGLDE
jgi:hypothetical protein